MKYKVVFYTTSKGSPIQELLDSISSKLRTKIMRQIMYVQEYGLSFAIPNIKKIRNTDIWELRILGKDNVRLFCVSQKDRTIKILHIFKKKSQKTPTKELALAMKRKVGS